MVMLLLLPLVQRHVLLSALVACLTAAVYETCVQDSRMHALLLATSQARSQSRFVKHSSHISKQLLA
jgi:type IV secretory pathway VirB3-like protein